MGKFIGIQAGHQNIQTNCDAGLRPGTGAPGEKDNNVRIRDRLGQMLVSKGFQVQLDDANANCTPNTTGKNFDFYLALHCESDTHGQGGGMVTAPDPSVDVVNAESRRIAQIIAGTYFPSAGITNQPAWITNNMTFYYMWNALSASTPCALLEMGVAQDAHDKVILGDTDRVAGAIARAICKAFNVPFDPVPPPVPVTDWQKKYTDEVAAHTETQKQLQVANDRLKSVKDFVAAA